MSDDVIFGPPAPEPHGDYWDPLPPGIGADGKPIFVGQGPLYAGGWDTAMLAGEKLPGICDVKCERTLQIDQQKGPKSDGAALVMNGVLPATVDITVTIWTEEQWTKFIAIVPLFWRKPNKDSPDVQARADNQQLSLTDAQNSMAASAIFWPGLIYLDISQVIVTSISAPEPGPVEQSKNIRIKCLEYQPPTRKTAPSKVKKATGRRSGAARQPKPSTTHCTPEG
jgi:hypothetical protein